MKKGFTLSEVLITMGIIGVVSALTIPAVIKSYKNKLLVSQLKKVYSQLSDATQRAMADEHSQDFYQTAAGLKNSCKDDEGECGGAKYFLDNYFKVPTSRSDCASKTNTKNGTSCVASSYKSISGKAATPVGGDYCIQTANVSTICMSFDTDNGVASIMVDVNGTSEPNITGRDAFWMDIQSDGTIIDHENTDSENCSSPEASGCLNRIIEDGWKIEY